MRLMKTTSCQISNLHKSGLMDFQWCHLNAQNSKRYALTVPLEIWYSLLFNPVMDAELQKFTCIMSLQVHYSISVDMKLMWQLRGTFLSTGYPKSDDIRKIKSHKQKIYMQNNISKLLEIKNSYINILNEETVWWVYEIHNSNILWLVVVQLGRQLKRPKYHTIQTETQLKQHDIPKNI